MTNLNKQLHFSAHMGRMGNQMFQYACAKKLEKVNGFTCSLDDLEQLKYFKLSLSARFNNKVKSKFFFHVAKRIKGIEIHNLEFDDMLKDYSDWFAKLDKPTMIWGFFQSELYFKPIETIIKKQFEIKEEYTLNFKNFLKKNKLMLGTYNAVHIRRTDYKGFTVIGLEGDNFILPNSYYSKALKLIEKNIPLVIVSDDPEYCKQEFANLENVVFAAEDAITDFQLLSNAKELIISNSTFAWWAAWLNKYTKQVICPKYFLGFKEEKETPINIYPSQWKAINVY